MKEKILFLLKEVINLLDQCEGVEEKANWFREKYSILKEKDLKDFKFKETILSIEKILAGMGSLADLPLYPKKESSITRPDIRKKQWDLVEKLGEEITFITNSSK